MTLGERPSAWQRVLHGGACELRREVAQVIMSEKGPKAAYRYACCGLADQLVRRGEEVFVSPRGCGHKLCPRCGRRRGGKYARRIIGWMAERPHGDLWAMCLTQKIDPREDLAAVRARMAPKQRAFMRWATGQGMTAGMTAVHCTWSPRVNGWHYHVHVLAEFAAGSMTKDRMLDKWQAIDPSARVDRAGHQCRLVQAAGPAIAELKQDSGDADFWNEAPAEVAKAVQYPLRDLVQGITAWRLGGDAEQLRECATQLVRQACGWKMFRAWGNWRKAVPIEKAPEADAAADGGDSVPAPAAPSPMGTVGRLWRAARAGDSEARDAFRRLERSARNASDFAKRLVKYCRFAWCTPGTS